MFTAQSLNGLLYVSVTPSGTVVVKFPSGRVRSTRPSGAVSTTRKSLFVAVTTTDADMQSAAPVPHTIAPLKFASLSSSSRAENGTAWFAFQLEVVNESDATDGTKRESVAHTRSVMFVAGFAARRKETDPESPSTTPTAFVEATTVGADPCGRRTR